MVPFGCQEEAVCLTFHGPCPLVFFFILHFFFLILTGPSFLVCSRRVDRPRSLFSLCLSPPPSSNQPIRLSYPPPSSPHPAYRGGALTTPMEPPRRQPQNCVLASSRLATYLLSLRICILFDSSPPGQPPGVCPGPRRVASEHVRRHGIRN